MVHNSATLAGVLSYEDLVDKPKINSVQLSGNKTLEDLGINELTEENLNEFLNETEVQA